MPCRRTLYEGGFAGICYPKEYGGLGLTSAYQRAFNEEVVGYEMPMRLQFPTFTICGPTILDMGSEEHKREHLAAAIRGDEVLVQFLSEPRGGSDLAGATTRAERDGDVFVLNGSKIWSSGAYAADYALCLARTDWDAPKHRGPDDVPDEGPSARHHDPHGSSRSTAATSSARSSSTTSSSRPSRWSAR